MRGAPADCDAAEGWVRGAALAGGINNLLLWYAGADLSFVVVYLISTAISGAVIAGALSWLLARGLAATGALDRFASTEWIAARSVDMEVLGPLVLQTLICVALVLSAALFDFYRREI